MKTFLKNFLTVLIFVVFALLNVTCANTNTNWWVGVGIEVDTIAPTISITSHKDGRYMPEKTLTISGKYSDNIGVRRVVVILTTDGSDKSLTSDNYYDPKKTGTWKATFKLSDLESLHLFDQEGDAKVYFDITAYDEKENKGFTSLFLCVDTQAPEIEWQKPALNTRINTEYEEKYFDDRTEFEEKYSMDDPNAIGCFHNGVEEFSGFTSDNFGVSSIYLRFYPKAEIDKGVDGKPMAVTPVIDKKITEADITAMNFTHSDDYELLGVPEIGVPIINAKQNSWRFTIDTKSLTTTEEWIKVEIVTEDEAGNKREDFVSEEENPWIFIRQSADVPRNKFSFNAGGTDTTITYGGVVSGTAFDDDGVLNVYIAAIPDKEDEKTALLAINPVDWGNKVEKSKVIQCVKSLDYINGSSMMPWSVTVPENGGDYIVYVVPYDKNSVYPTDYATNPLYNRTFHVAAENDPTIVIDTAHRGATILDKYPITGYFYDNKSVKKITASLYKNDSDTPTGKITIYNGEFGSESKIARIHQENITLPTGQPVTKFLFSYLFDPEDFGADYIFKNIKIKFEAFDEDENFGNDEITAYGDLESPKFVDGSVHPENNSSIITDTIFDGDIIDNVDIDSLVIKCPEISGFGEIVFKPTPIGSEFALGEKIFDGVTGKYKRHFECTITPTMMKNQGGEIIIEATDKSGNTTQKSIFIKADTTPPGIAFSGIKNGSYINNLSSFTVDVSHDTREIRSYCLKVNDVTVDFIKEMSEKYFTKTFTIADLALSDGDKTIKVYADDMGGNFREASLYFIVDNTAPKDMEITFPSMLDKTGIEALTNTVSNIPMEEISYYLNNTVSFKGIGSDNYKIAKTTVDIYTATDIKTYSIIIDYDLSGNMRWSAIKVSDSSNWDDGVTDVDGVPSNYNIEIDTTKMADGNYYMQLNSVDSADNSADSLTATTDKRYFKVLQAADKPKISFNTNDGDTVFSNYEITGMAYDDDGFSQAKTFKYALAKTTETGMESIWSSASTTITPKVANTFSFNVPERCVDDGFWTLWIQPIDKNGTLGDIYKLHLTVSSSNNPVVSSLSIGVGDGGRKQSDTYADKVKVETSVSSGSSSTQVSQIMVRIYSSMYPSIDTTADISQLGVSNRGGWYIKQYPATSDAETYIFDFDSSKFVPENGKLTVEVKTVNTAKITSTAERQSIMIDNEIPIVSIINPSAGSTIDGNVTVSGTIKELGSSVKNVYISYLAKSTLTDSYINNLTESQLLANTVAKGESPVSGKWLDLGSFTTSWNCEYNSTLLQDKADYTIVVAGVDELGNVGTQKINVYVDQDNDRPIVTISNMDLTGKTNSHPIGNDQGSIIGSVYDDDGTVKEIYYSLDNTAWTKISTDSTTFTYVSDSDGVQSIFLKIVDAKGTIFESKTSSSDLAIKLRDNKGNQFGEKGSLGSALDTVIYTMMDTTNPVISNIKYSSNDADYYDIAGIDSVIFGGTKNKIYIKFDATDANGIGSAKYSFAGDAMQDVTSTKSGNTYKCEIDVSDVASGAKVLELVATDNVGKTDNMRYSVEIDNTKPNITITSPAGAQTIDKTITVTGTANDASAGLKAMYISYLSSSAETFNGLTAAQITSNVAANTAGKWTLIPVGTSWSYTNYDTTKITTSSKENYVLAVAAIDNNDNVGISTLTVNIDQDNDRPVVNLSNLILTGMTSTNRSWLNAASIYGVVNDADGVVQSISYSTNGTDYNQVAENTNSFTIPLDDGDKNVYIKVVDAKGTTFVSQSTVDNGAIIIEDGLPEKSGGPNKFGLYADRNDTTGKKNTILYLTVDTKNPEISNVLYFDYAANNYVTAETISTAVFGGADRKTLKLKFDATDANGIAHTTFKPQVEFEGNTVEAIYSGADPKYNGTYTCEIDISSAPSGTKPFIIKVKDISAESSGAAAITKQYSIKLDNEGPIIEFTNPNDGTEVYGSLATNRIRGNASDSSSISHFYVGYSKTASATPTSTTDAIASLGSAISTFNLWFDGLANVDDSEEYHTGIYNSLKDSSGTDIINTAIDDPQDLYVWAKAVDELGNEGDWSKINLRVLANADKPKVSIEYPTTNSSVGGTIRINGTTEIEASAVDSVWVQIDPNYNGVAFNESGWEAATQALMTAKGVTSYVIDEKTIEGHTVRGIKATGNVKSWSLPINAAKEFNMGDGSSRTMAIRAYAIEVASGKTAVSDVIVFTVDPNAPVFGDTAPVVVRKSSQPTVYKTYTDGMWIVDGGDAKTWELYGSIEDDSGIANLTLTYSINGVAGTEVIVQDNNVKKSAWIASQTTPPQTSPAKNYCFKIPVKTQGDYGSVTYTLEAEEYSDNNPKTTTKTCIIKYDKKNPTITLKDMVNGMTIKQLTVDSDDFTSFNGGVTEAGENGLNQSGYDRVVMSITRTVGGTTYVIDPMLDKGTTGTDNRYNVSSLTAVEGLYCRTVSGVEISDGSSLTLPSTVKPNENNIRIGGVCIINGIMYRIDNVAGQVVSIKGTLNNEANATVNFAIGQVIDNMSVESGDANTEYSYKANGDPDVDGLSNQDGDQMKEGVKENGADYAWNCSINSWNIYDGPIDMKFVAFDKAGNSASASVSATVSNNGPRIAGVSFGTDTNGDGSITGTELKTAYSGMYDTNGANCIEGVTVNGCNLDGKTFITTLKAPSNLATPVFVIKDKIVIKPEIVGGNGGLTWALKRGSTTIKSGDSGLSGSNDTSVRTFNVELSIAELCSKIGSDFANETLDLVITDKTEGQGNIATISIQTSTVLYDTTNPKVNIAKFHWTDKTNNSVYQVGGKLQGHIELEDELPTSIFTATTGEYDKDPKVSGIIVFDGTCDDNVRIDQINITIGNVNNVAVATRNTTTGVLNAINKTVASDGYQFIIDSDSITDDGDVVSWKFIWDSSKVSGIATLDQNFTLTAKDRGKYSSGNYTPNSTSKSYRVDVVPYITGLSTRMDDAYASNTSVFNRSANGYYPVLRGEAGVKVYGYNLNGASTTVKFNGTSVGTVTAKPSTDKKETRDYVSFTVPSAATSGEIEVVVNSINSLNNKNNDNEEYNQEPNGTNNEILTDTRNVWVWGTNTLISDASLRYPSFKIGKNNSQTVGVTYDSGAQSVNMYLNGTFRIDYSYTQWYDTAVAIDSAGRIYGSAMNGDSGGGSCNQGNPATMNYANYGFYAWNNSSYPGRIYYNGSYNYAFNSSSAYSSGYKKVCLENSYNGSIFNSQRVLNPKIAVNSTNQTNSTGYVYTVYYDAIDNEVRFRYGTVSGNMNSNSQLTFSDGLANHNNNTIGTAEGYQTIAFGTSAGEYSAVGVTSNGYAAVCWYDTGEHALKYRYSTNTVCTLWSSPITIDDDYAGEYCNLAVDADDGIHIAYFRAGGKLKYAYLSSYKANKADVCMVDSYLSVGTNISIETSSKTITKNGTTRYVPYISYFTDALKLAKVAWPVALGTNEVSGNYNTFTDGALSDRFTGSWEVQCIPTKLTTTLLNYTIGVGEKSNGSENSVMLGYGTKIGLETALLY